MTPNDVIDVLGAANPLPNETAEVLRLPSAESELLRLIVAEPSPSRGRGLGARWPGRRRLLLGGGAAAAAVAVIGIGLLGGGGGGPAPAFAAALVRFANSTPRLLLQVPGWHVNFVEPQPDGSGEMHFIRGRANAAGMPATSLTGEASLLDRYAQLNWSPGRADPAKRRYIEAGHSNIPTGLGVPVTRLMIESKARDWMDVIGSLIYRGEGISLRVTVRNMADLRRVLADLKQVDATTWLEAMPASVIKSASSAPAIHQMLSGIPLPPGFDAGRIPGVHSTQTNYYLGTELTGTVACMWIADWNHARATHNTSEEARATAAMATAPHWPVFRWMSRQGAWPQVLIQLAQAMPRGTWFGKSLAGAANDGLGCAQLGVKLQTHLGLKPVSIGRP